MRVNEETSCITEACHVEEIEPDAIDITVNVVLILLSIYILIARLWRKHKESTNAKGT